MVFHDITLDDKAEFSRIVGGREFLSCEYHFSHLFIWKDTDKIKLCFDGDTVFIAESRYGCFMLPLTNDMPRAVALLREHCAAEGRPLEIMSVYPEALQELAALGGRAERIPDLDDYIYLASDLRDLPGGRYHKKRNHIAQFESRYDFRFEPINDGNIEDCKRVDREWIERRGGSESEYEEKSALYNALDNMEALGLCGGALYADGELCGFSVGEVADTETGIVHFEKGNIDFVGVYPEINKLFAQKYFGGVEYINREDDMGSVSLRKSKQSYYPCKMAEKYKVTI